MSREPRGPGDSSLIGRDEKGEPCCSAVGVEE